MFGARESGRSVVVVAAWLVVGAFMGCGDAGNEGLDATQDVAEEFDMRSCPVNWEKTPRTDVAPAGKPVYYNRPYFTTCKDGAFYSSAWMSYDEPITEFDPETPNNRVPCRSGRCRDGICEDDLEYIEGKLQPGDQLQPGRFGFMSYDCRVCNPNNALYSLWEPEFKPSSHICDGGEVCCEEHLPNDGPCDIEDTRWGFGVGSADDKNIMNLQSDGYANCDGYGCSDVPCALVNGGSCVAGTSTLQKIDWDNSDCNSQSVGHLRFNGERHTIEHATIWMGNRKDFWDTIHGESTCLDKGMRPLLSMTYFTCSGAAIVQTTDGRWFKAVWIHRYGPSNCDEKPCWMAAQHEKLPVDFLLTELPGDPGKI